MKIATWNVNSMKVRMPHVLEWLSASEPDVLVLQEIKQLTENFPADALQEIGYHSIANGQKTYNGVAILSREEAADPVRDIPGLDDPQRRILAATVGDVRGVDVDVVNGSEVGSEKFDYKLLWLEKVTDWLAGEIEAHPNLVVVGDFNIAPDDRDVHDPEAWHERILCSTPEREAMGRMLGLGLQDTFRLFPQEEKSFSWWDYRAAAFRRNMGLRIDLILASQALAGQCTACLIDKAPRRLERPSDHTPVVAEFNL